MFKAIMINNYPTPIIILIIGILLKTQMIFQELLKIEINKKGVQVIGSL